MTHTQPFDPTLQRALDHMFWADGLVLGALLHAGNSAPGASVTLYAHILGAEIIWLDRIQEVPQSSEVWPDPDLRWCSQQAPLIRQRVQTVLDGAASAREVSYTNSAGQAFRTPVSDILLHVALHGAYHRGQVARVLREEGLEPAPTDYIAYVRGVAAARHPISL